MPQIINTDESIKSIVRYIKLGDDAYIANLRYELNQHTSINLAFKRIDCTGAEVLANALVSNKSLSNINLSGNRIGEEGAHFLAIMIELREKLRRVDLSDNNIGDAGAKKIAAAFRKKSQRIAEELAYIETVSTIYHKHYNFVDKTSLAVAAGRDEIEKRQDFAILLSRNNIGDEGALALADALKRSPCGHFYIDLSGNQIGDAGAVAFADVLRLNSTSLFSINLRDNNISDEGALSLTDALNTNSKLYEISKAAKTSIDAILEERALSSPIIPDYKSKVGNNYRSQKQQRGNEFASFFKTWQAKQNSTDIDPSSQTHLDAGVSSLRPSPIT